MDNQYYEMLFKRKSFHTYMLCGNEKLTDKELQELQEAFTKCVPLEGTIKVDMRIVPAKESSCKRGQEYCLYFYSEVKPNHLANIGYIGEQMDLYLASKNIGALWFGIGKVEETTYNGLEFVIMMAIRKVPQDKFRKDMFKSKRKTIEEIWSGEPMDTVANIVRFAPSACNSQPWKVENIKDTLHVYRYKQPGKRGIMPANKVSFYNGIDIGIFLLFLEVCLQQEGVAYERQLFVDEGSDIESTSIAKYSLNTKE